MGKIIIQEETTKLPISLIGKESGVCYGSDITDPEKNYKRGMENIKSNHGRTLELPQIYMVLEGYSARVIREFYTHIGGSPTRLQASTRYIGYDDFDYIIPPTIADNSYTIWRYNQTMKQIMSVYEQLIENFDIPREDAANLLPLGMKTKVVCRTNLRNIVDMSHQRMCNRAYWEYRDLMQDLKTALSDYSDEWKRLADMLFVPKCTYLGHCPEAHPCYLGKK